MNKATWINVNGIWEQITNVWENVGGIWKQKIIPKLNIGGVWKELISYTWLKTITVPIMSKQYNNYIFVLHKQGYINKLSKFDFNGNLLVEASINCNYSYNLILDNNGNAYVGTNGYICKYDFNLNLISDMTKNLDVYQLACDGNRLYYNLDTHIVAVDLNNLLIGSKETGVTLSLYGYNNFVYAPQYYADGTVLVKYDITTSNSFSKWATSKYNSSCVDLKFYGSKVYVLYHDAVIKVYNDSDGSLISTINLNPVIEYYTAFNVFNNNIYVENSTEVKKYSLNGVLISSKTKNTNYTYGTVVDLINTSDGVIATSYNSNHIGILEKIQI